MTTLAPRTCELTRGEMTTVAVRIAFRVPAVPVAQPRQRHRIMSIGGRQMVGNFTPAKHPVNAFKAAVQLAARQMYTGAPLEGPLRLAVTFVLPRPKSMCWKKRPQPRAWHQAKPDADNLAKAVMDALLGTVWRDDNQVCWLLARKLYASGAEQPGVEVEVRQLGEEV